MKNILENLNKELKYKGISKKDVCKDIGISYTSVVNYLNGIRMFPLDIFLKILETYKINYNNILEPKYFQTSNSITSEKETELNLKIYELEIRLDECRKTKKIVK